MWRIIYFSFSYNIGKTCLYCRKYIIIYKIVKKNVLNFKLISFSTPLHIAIQADNKPIFNLLLKQDYLDVNLKNNEEHSPLYYALLKYESGDDFEDSYISGLMNCNVHTNPIYSDTGNSLLQVLIISGFEKSAVFLSAKVPNLNHVNNEGNWSLFSLRNFLGNLK